MSDLIVALYLAGALATISSLLIFCIWAIAAGIFRFATLPKFAMWVSGNAMTVMLVILSSLLFAPMSHVIISNRLAIYALGVCCVFSILGTISSARLCLDEQNRTK